MNGTTNITPSEIVNVIGGGISKEQAETFAQQMVGDYGWLLLVAIITIMAKDMIMNFVQGIPDSNSNFRRNVLVFSGTLVVSV